MNINLEASSGNNEIVSYDDNQVVIRTISKEQLSLKGDFILSSSKLLQDKSISFELSEDIGFLINLKPEVLIISSNEADKFPYKVRTLFESHAIGVEVMKMGPACRTYNLLISEQRDVYLVIQS